MPVASQDRLFGVPIAALPQAQTASAEAMDATAGEAAAAPADGDAATTTSEEGDDKTVSTPEAQPVGQLHAAAGLPAHTTVSAACHSMFAANCRVRCFHDTTKSVLWGTFVMVLLILEQVFLQPPPVQREGSCLRVHSGSFCLPAKTLRRVMPPDLARVFAAARSDNLVRHPPPQAGGTGRLIG
jgi:hypothetical protein